MTEHRCVRYVGARASEEIESSDYQLTEWVAGRPQHNYAVGSGGECCPDFSCCQPELLVDKETREAFRDASELVRLEMLGMFLGAMLDGEGKNVHIAGGPYEEGA